MMTLFRVSAKTLLIETRAPEELTAHLMETFSVDKGPYIEMAGKVKDAGCLIVFADHLDGVVSFSASMDSLWVPVLSDEVLMGLINEEKTHLIHSLRLAPRPILLRHRGDAEAVLSEMAKDFSGQRDTFYQLMDQKSGGVVIALTEASLDSPVDFREVYPSAYHVAEPLMTVIDRLKKKDIDYFNASAPEGQWREYHIKIYDAFEAYEIHYDRLIEVLEGLELGVVTGEGWGTDAAFILMSVGVYQVRFFSFLSPVELKRTLLGLEYLDDGTRVVDLDLFVDKKKISWREARRESGEAKFDISSDYRRMIWQKLNGSARQTLEDLEVKILKTRY